MGEIAVGQRMCADGDQRLCRKRFEFVPGQAEIAAELQRQRAQRAPLTAQGEDLTTREVSARYRLTPDGPNRLPCFAGDTVVWTPAGPRRIDALAVGDEVVAWDFTAGRRVARRVLQCHRNRTLHWRELTVGGKIIRTTREHRFWAAARAAWLPARELRAGVTLQALEGPSVAVDAAAMRPCDPSPTFNLEVDGDHNYFVGPGVLVHNGVDVGLGGRNLIYVGTNPDFPGWVYVGRTFDLEREQQHHREAIHALEDIQAGRRVQSPTDVAAGVGELEFWRFKAGMTLVEVAHGINDDARQYFEQANMNWQGDNGMRVVNRRQEVSERRWPEEVARITATYCP